MIGVAAPLGAMGLLAVAALVVLHLLERRRRTVAVSTLRLWVRLPPATLARRRFRADLLLLLQVAAALALTGALLRPYLERPAVGVTAALVAVVDVSASMGAREQAGTRLELARGRVRALVDALPAGVETLLVAAGRRPVVIRRWTADRAQVRAGLETIEALDVGTNLAPAVELGLASARAHPPARVVVVTDLAREASDLPADALDAVDYVRIGRTDDNVALTSVRTDAGPFVAPGQAIVTAEVRSFSAVARRVTLSARVGGRAWARRPIELAPRGTASVALGEPPEAGLVTLALDAGDALAADDRAVAWIPSPPPLDLVVVSDDDAFVRRMRALARALPGARAEAVPTRAYRALTARRGSTVVLDGVVPDPVPAANLLVIAPPPGQALCPVARRLPGAAVVDWDAGHPALAGLDDLQALDVSDVRVLDPPAWGTSAVVAAAPGVTFPLLVTGERGGTRIACVGARPANDDVPALLLLLGTLRWLADSSAATPLAVTTGTPVLVGDDVVVPEHVGSQTIDTPAGPRLLLANLLDARESDIGRGDEEAWTAAPAAGATVAHAEMGGWLALAAALVLAAEWVVWARR